MTMRAVCRLSLLAGLVLIVFAFTMPGAAFSKRYYGFEGTDWEPAQPWFWGNLTWKGGVGRISWDPDPTSEDNMPADTRPQDATTPHQYDAQEYLGNENNYDVLGCMLICPVDTEPVTGGLSLKTVTYGTKLVPDYLPDVFTSDPLPRTLYVNFTRGMEVDLFLLKFKEDKEPCKQFDKHTPGEWPAPQMYASWFEPQLDLEVTDEAGKPLAGAYTGDSWGWNLPESINPDYGLCPFAMQSEALILEKGTVLKLKIHHNHQKYWYPYGLQGDHRSQIRISLFWPDDLLDRYPDLALTDPELDPDARPAPTTDAQGGRESAAPLALAAVLLAAPTFASRSRGKAGVILALLALSVFAGCLDAKDKSLDARRGEQMGGTFTNTVVEDYTGQLADATFGAIIGVAHDDLNLPTRGIHVSILNLGNFTETSPRGKFTFLGIPPGTHRLRFDHKDYFSLEAQVEVKAGSISKPDVTLQPRVAKAGDDRPHLHDYWDGQAVKSYPELTMPLGCIYDRENWGCSNNARQTRTPADPRLVNPGNAILEVKLNWDKEKLGMDRIGLAIHYPNSWWGDETAVFMPRGPNEPFRVLTSWEMTDQGHALFSRWSFTWFRPYTELPSQEEYRAQHLPGHDFGEVTLTMTGIRGGALDIDPAHKDLWKGKNTYKFAEDAQNWASLWGYGPPGSPCLTGWVDCYEMSYGSFWWTRPVPPLTEKIEVTVRRMAQANPEFGITLHYKTADTIGGNSRTLEGYKMVEPQAGGSWEGWKFLIDVAPGQTDTWYDEWWSSWDWTIRSDDPNAEWMAYTANQYVTGEVAPVDLTYRMDAVAIRNGGD